MACMSAIPFQREIVYPESDGEPMAETEFHLDETIYLIEALRERFRAAGWDVERRSHPPVEGELRVVKASPDEFVQLAKWTVSGKGSWAHLAVAGNRLYVKDREHLHCYEL